MSPGLGAFESTSNPCVSFFHFVYPFGNCSVLSAHSSCSKTVMLYICILQSAGSVEYTDCTSAVIRPRSNECAVYDTKQSDGEVGVT